MSIFRQDLVILSCHPILNCLTIGSGAVTAVENEPTTVNLPLIRNFDFIRDNARLFGIFRINKNVITNALDYLSDNGHINFKMKNLRNKYDRTLHITAKGFDAIDYSFYTKLFIKRWGKIIKDLGILTLIGMAISYLKRGC